MKEYIYDELYVGQEEAFSVHLTAEMMENFRNITGDLNPLHVDERFARDRGFPDKVAYGMLTASFLSTLAGVYLPGKNSLIHSVSVEFPKPVFVGDTLEIRGIITEKDDRFHVITVKIAIRSQQNKVCRGSMKIGVIQ